MTSALGCPRLSMTSAISLSSSERMALTISQNACVCGGGALGLKSGEVERPEMIGDRFRAACVELRPVFRPVVWGEGARLDG